jgi:hypothetical protein
MRAFNALWGVGVAVCVTVGLLAMAGGAMAVPLRICVPEKEGAAIKTPKKGVCAAKTTATVVLPEDEEEKLAAILPYEKYMASGVGGKPTIQLSGVNLQIESGSGSTFGPVNGAGNLIIGYNESPGTETGSNNLVVGINQSYTSYGSVVAGRQSTDSGPYSAVFGYIDKAEGTTSTVAGGTGNTARAEGSSVSGGFANLASGIGAWVGGGAGNTASGEGSSVSAGEGNTASGRVSSVTGGGANTASGELSAILGGHKVTESAVYGVSP